MVAAPAPSLRNDLQRFQAGLALQQRLEALSQRQELMPPAQRVVLRAAVLIPAKPRCCRGVACAIPSVLCAALMDRHEAVVCLCCCAACGLIAEAANVGDELC